MRLSELIQEMDFDEAKCILDPYGSVLFSRPISYRFYVFSKLPLIYKRLFSVVHGGTAFFEKIKEHIFISSL